MTTLKRFDVRLPRLEFVVRLLFAMFLFGTGIMTIGLAINGLPETSSSDRVGQFMIALHETGYLIYWVGLFKAVTGGLMFVPRTTPLAILMVLPYSVNILLYVTFFAHRYFMIGLLDFVACGLLVYGYWDWYRPIVVNSTAASIHTS